MKTWNQWLENMVSPPKKPEKTEDHPCETCGKPATSYYFGIGAGGNEDWQTKCSDSRCPSNQGQQHVGQFV